MSNFNRIYKSILVEGRVPSIFRKATPEELAERAVRWGKIQMDEWVNNFLKREDLRKNKDGSYDVDGCVDFLGLKPMTRLPVRFGKVVGDFLCDHTPITSLEGSPTTVGSSFCCDRTRITSLEGAPTTVGIFFNCFNTPITSLEGAPKRVGYDFNCWDCGRKFTVEEVREHCDVKGKINV